MCTRNERDSRVRSCLPAKFGAAGNFDLFDLSILISLPHPFYPSNAPYLISQHKLSRNWSTHVQGRIHAWALLDTYYAYARNPPLLGIRKGGWHFRIPLVPPSAERGYHVKAFRRNRRLSLPPPQSRGLFRCRIARPDISNVRGGGKKKKEKKERRDRRVGYSVRNFVWFNSIHGVSKPSARITRVVCMPAMVFSDFWARGDCEFRIPV